MALQDNQAQNVSLNAKIFVGFSSLRSRSVFHMVLPENRIKFIRFLQSGISQFFFKVCERSVDCNTARALMQ